MRGVVAALLRRAGPAVGGWSAGGSGGTGGMGSAQAELHALVDEVRRGCIRYACDGGGLIAIGGGGGSRGGGGSGDGGGSGGGGGGVDLEGGLDLECFEVACAALAKGGGGASATEQLTRLVAIPP